MGICRLHVFFLCMVASVISGCQTNSTNQSTTTSSSNSWSSSTALKTAEKPKYAPFDWKPEDADSREVWFQEKVGYQMFGDNFCGIFFQNSNTDINYSYLRNGNVIIVIRTSSNLSQILSVRANPEDSLVAIQGIKGLQPERILAFELTDAFKKLDIEYIYEYEGKEISKFFIRRNFYF